MRGPYRTIEDVLRSPWAAIERPEEGSGTDRVLRSTRLEDSIYADLRDGDDALEQTEGDAAKKLPSFPALARDVFQSFYSLMPRKNGEDMLTVAARKFNGPHFGAYHPKRGLSHAEVGVRGPGAARLRGGI